MIPIDVKVFIARTFNAADQQAALSILAAAIIQDGSEASPSLIRCAPIASGGSLARLHAEVAKLKVDWRGGIFAGENESVGGRLSRARGFKQPLTKETKQPVRPPPRPPQAPEGQEKGEGLCKKGST